MCGRYALYTPVEAVARLFGVNEMHAADLAPRYNIAPTQDVPVVRVAPWGEEAGGESEVRELAVVRWGLVPFWAKDASIGNRMINARAETVAGKPAFRAAFSRRRCLVPADGFFEWQKTADGKQPWYIHAAANEPMAFAGLWEVWDGKGTAPPLASCTIITTRANRFMAPLHDRMPVVLEGSDRDAWLDPDAPGPVLQGLLEPHDDLALEAHAVSRKVNSPFNEAPELLRPVRPPGGSKEPGP
jgi:putative SOS response-associated peptidase YedK